MILCSTAAPRNLRLKRRVELTYLMSPRVFSLAAIAPTGRSSVEDSGVWRRIQCQLQRGIAVECADFDNGARPQLLRQRADKSELLDADIAIGRMKVLEGNGRFFAKEIKRGNRCDGAAADHYVIIDAEELLLDFARISSKTADDRGDLPQFVPRRNQSFRPSSVLRR